MIDKLSEIKRKQKLNNNRKIFLNVFFHNLYCFFGGRQSFGNITEHIIKQFKYQLLYL